MPERFAPNSTGLRQQLKRGTASVHRQLEAQLGLLEPDLTLQRYRRVLQAFLGFYAPVEAGLASLAVVAPPLGVPLRARSKLLAGDLLSLGMSPRELADLPRCAELPRLSCLEDFAGCLYVLEGACLGGQVIAPRLHQRLGVAQGKGASFFIGDAGDTSARWLLILSWLEGLFHTGARTEEIVASARATFCTFARWVELQQTLQSPVLAG